MFTFLTFSPTFYLFVIFQLPTVKLLFSSRYISLDLIFLGSAEAVSGCGGKLDGHLMPSCVRNICTNNYHNFCNWFSSKN